MFLLVKIIHVCIHDNAKHKLKHTVMQNNIPEHVYFSCMTQGLSYVIGSRMTHGSLDINYTKDTTSQWLVIYFKLKLKGCHTNFFLQSSLECYETVILESLN